MSFNNLTVKAKLTLVFGVLAFMVLLISGFAIKTLGNANERLTDFVNGINARALASAGVRTAVERRAIAARNLVLVSSPTDIQHEKELVTKAHEDVNNRLPAPRVLTQTPTPDIGFNAAYAPIADLTGLTSSNELTIQGI